MSVVYQDFQLEMNQVDVVQPDEHRGGESGNAPAEPASDGVDRADAGQPHEDEHELVAVEVESPQAVIQRPD